MTLEATDARHLYEPLASTPQLVLEQMEEVEMRPALVFRLTPTGASDYPVPLPEELYWDENKAVFYQLGGDADGENFGDWYYFNSHKLRIEPILDEPTLEGDLIPTGEGTFSIYRSISVEKGGAHGTADLELFRYDFVKTEENTIEVEGYQRITSAAGADYQAIPIYGTERIVYVHHEKDGPQTLMVGDPYAGPARPLFDDQDFNAMFPNMLSDGRMVFVSDIMGYLSLYQIDDGVDYIRRLETERAKDEGKKQKIEFADVARPFVYPFPEDEHKGRMILASMGDEGKLRPVLERLPESMGLAGIADLVRAHNPGVNQHRAQYAAAILNAAQFKLNNYPRLDLGISYDQSVEFLDDFPLIFTGDIVTKQILRFLVGITQPLLDFHKNRALTQSALKEAEVFRYRLEREINDRVAEASALYFETVYLSQRIEIETEQLAVTEKRRQYYLALHEQYGFTRLQLMAAAQVSEGILSERAFDYERLAFLKDRLKEVMGIRHDAEFDLNLAPYDFDTFEMPTLDEAVHIAQLNHPSIKLSENALASAFYHQAAGPDIRPTAVLSGRYEHRTRSFQQSALTPFQSTTLGDTTDDEIVGIALVGQYPLAGRKAKKLHNRYWTETINTLRLLHDQIIREVKIGMEEAHMDFQASQRDLRAKRSSQYYFLEKLRVARLHHEFGPPETPLELLRPPDEPGTIQDIMATGVLAPLSAEFEFLRALDKSLKVEMSLGMRFSKVWREMGLITRLTDEAPALERAQRARTRPSTWLWRTKDHVITDDAVNALIAELKSRDVRRVYTYLYADGGILSDRQERERMTLFTALCAHWDIEVWALLGEPEWIEENNTAALSGIIQRVLAFNDYTGRFEPKIAGIKLDLEPHTLAGWDDDEERRALLEGNYRNLLETARAELGGEMPLWADLPAKFFREEEAALLSDLEDILDGATLMSYFDSENAIVKWGGMALDAFGKPLEIGIEFSEKAPSGNTVATWSPQKVAALEQTLNEQFGQHAYYAGTALHDYGALVAFSRRD